MQEAKFFLTVAVLWHNIWISCGRPRRGAVYDIMRQTRNKYHYAVRKVKRSEENIRKNGGFYQK